MRTTATSRKTMRKISYMMNSQAPSKSQRRNREITPSWINSGEQEHKFPVWKYRRWCRCGRHHQPLDFGLCYCALTYRPHACTPPSTLPWKSTDPPEALMLGKSGSTTWSRFLPQLPEGARVKVRIGSASVTGFSQVTEGFESFT